MMANLLLALLFAITATKEYVDRRDATTYTNAVSASKAYTDSAIIEAGAVTPQVVTNIVDAKIAEIPQGGVSTNAVSGIITNHVTSGYLCTVAAADGKYLKNHTSAYDQPQLYWIDETTLGGVSFDFACPGKITTVSFGDPNGNIYSLPSSSGTLALTSDVTGNSLTNGGAKAYADAAVASITASSIGAYPAASGTTLASQVATIGAHLNAEDARFVVTNYNSVTYSPEAYVEIKLQDSTWSRIWSEMTRWNWLTGTYLPTNFYTKAVVDAALAEKADRAWGCYDSTTGAYAPDDYTWISSKNVAIAADLSYQKTVTSEGAIWVLTSQGGVTDVGSATNGYFRISDDEGNSIFEIVKGDKRTLGANATNLAIVAGYTPTKMRIGYSVVSQAHPTIYVCNALSNLNWKAESDADCLANVAWSGSSGAWVAEVQGKAAQAQLFVKAEYEVGGETYIRNRAPVSMQYVIVNDVKYAVGTATISGHTVLTLTVAE